MNDFLLRPECMDIASTRLSLPYLFALGPRSAWSLTIIPMLTGLGTILQRIQRRGRLSIEVPCR